MIITSRLAPLVAVALSALTLAGCAGEKPPPAPAPPAAAPADAGDVNRYCALIAELNGIGERVFADLPEDASSEEYMRRESMFLEQAEAQLAELDQVAPVEIRADGALFEASMRARAAGQPGPDPAAVEAAEERERAFAERNCPLGPDGS